MDEKDATDFEKMHPLIRTFLKNVTEKIEQAIREVEDKRQEKGKR